MKSNFTLVCKLITQFSEKFAFTEYFRQNGGGKTSQFPLCACATATIFTVWKLWKFTVKHFWQKFRENNGFPKEVTKDLI